MFKLKGTWAFHFNKINKVEVIKKQKKNKIFLFVFFENFFEKKALFLDDLKNKLKFINLFSKSIIFSYFG